eukprot:403371840
MQPSDYLNNQSQSFEHHHQPHQCNQEIPQLGQKSGNSQHVSQQNLSEFNAQTDQNCDDQEMRVEQQQQDLQVYARDMTQQDQLQNSEQYLKSLLHTDSMKLKEFQMKMNFSNENSSQQTQMPQETAFPFVNSQNLSNSNHNNEFANFLMNAPPQNMGFTQSSVKFMHQESKSNQNSQVNQSQPQLDDTTQMECDFVIDADQNLSLDFTQTQPAQGKLFMVFPVDQHSLKPLSQPKLMQFNQEQFTNQQLPPFPPPKRGAKKQSKNQQAMQDILKSNQQLHWNQQQVECNQLKSKGRGKGHHRKNYSEDVARLFQQQLTFQSNTHDKLEDANLSQASKEQYLQLLENLNAQYLEQSQENTLHSAITRNQQKFCNKKNKISGLKDFTPYVKPQNKRTFKDRQMLEMVAEDEEFDQKMSSSSLLGLKKDTDEISHKFDILRSKRFLEFRYLQDGEQTAPTHIANPKQLEQLKSISNFDDTEPMKKTVRRCHKKSVSQFDLKNQDALKVRLVSNDINPTQGGYQSFPQQIPMFGHSSPFQSVQQQISQDEVMTDFQQLIANPPQNYMLQQHQIQQQSIMNFEIFKNLSNTNNSYYSHLKKQQENLMLLDDLPRAFSNMTLMNEELDYDQKFQFLVQHQNLQGLNDVLKTIQSQQQKQLESKPVVISDCIEFVDENEEMESNSEEEEKEPTVWQSSLNIYENDTEMNQLDSPINPRRVSIETDLRNKMHTTSSGKSNSKMISCHGSTGGSRNTNEKKLNHVIKESLDRMDMEEDFPIMQSSDLGNLKNNSIQKNFADNSNTSSLQVNLLEILANMQQQRDSYNTSLHTGTSKKQDVLNPEEQDARIQLDPEDFVSDRAFCQNMNSQDVKRQNMFSSTQSKLLPSQSSQKIQSTTPSFAQGVFTHTDSALENHMAMIENSQQNSLTGCYEQQQQDKPVKPQSSKSSKNNSSVFKPFQNLSVNQIKELQASQSQQSTKCKQNKVKQTKIVDDVKLDSLPYKNKETSNFNILQKKFSQKPTQNNLNEFKDPTPMLSKAKQFDKEQKVKCTQKKSQKFEDVIRNKQNYFSSSQQAYDQAFDYYDLPSESTKVSFIEDKTLPKRNQTFEQNQSTQHMMTPQFRYFQSQFNEPLSNVTSSIVNQEDSEIYDFENETSQISDYPQNFSTYTSAMQQTSNSSCPVFTRYLNQKKQSANAMNASSTANNNSSTTKNFR